MEQVSTTGLKPQANSEFSRLPPQAPNLENYILGAIMNEPVYDTVAEILKPEHFYITANQMIFEAMGQLARRGRTPDIISVVEQLKSTNRLEDVGGPYFISKINSGVVSAVNIDAHSRVILQKYLLRQLIKITGEINNTAYENGVDIFELLDEAEGKIFDLSVNNVTNDYTNLQQAMVKVVSRISELQQKGEDITGVKSGFANLDRITHGWQPTDLIILAARPSVGKSAFALNLARNAATGNNPTSVGFFSLEMSTEQLVQRILSAQSEIWLDRIKTGNMEEHHMEKLMKRGVLELENAKIFIDDTAGLSVAQLRSKARRMVMKENVGLIIIDYLQLMKAGVKKGVREQEISYISSELKILAKELKVPVIALAQLSREVEKRTIKLPVLSDLRESGSIEQDADIVGFIYRPSKEERDQDADLKTKGMVGIAKNRNGKLIDLCFEVDDNIQRWQEIGELGAEPISKFRPVSSDYTESKSNDFF